MTKIRTQPTEQHTSGMRVEHNRMPRFLKSHGWVVLSGHGYETERNIDKEQASKARHAHALFAWTIFVSVRDDSNQQVP